MAFSVCGLRINEFWELTPGEWKSILSAVKDKHEKDMQHIGMLSWYTGIAFKADLNRIGFKRWMEGFSDPEKVKKQREKSIDSNRLLYEQMLNKRKPK